jgi:hypothetical protein
VPVPILQNLVQPDYILTLIEKGEFKNWEKRRCSAFVSDWRVSSSLFDFI